MSLSLYDVSIPALTLGLTNLGAILDKAILHAEARKFDPNILAQTRVFPDMLPFTRQVMIACDMAKGCAARLAGIDNPKFEDTETTLAELKARVEKTKAFIATVQAHQFDGAEAREIVIPAGSRTLKFTGAGYVTKFVLPNFYFHSSMVYALLRHNGVEIGKGDFLGAIQ
jgi:hypothetical protein